MVGRYPEDDGIAEPPRLRHLRWLVNTLTVTLILGIVTVVGLLVVRLAPLTQPSELTGALPANVSLPGTERAVAVTFGDDWLAVVTSDREGGERIRIFDRRTGAHIQTVRVDAAGDGDAR